MKKTSIVFQVFNGHAVDANPGPGPTFPLE
jgi:hypothetical protein